ncbi:SigB/SigF/SigG family RNA polymerase sigma factor [soil metagenome]
MTAQIDTLHAQSPAAPERPPSSSTSSSTGEPDTADLLRRVAASEDPQERRRLLDEVVLLNLGVARSIAHRYRNRGIALDDLDQVARLGLVKAARGFDTDRQNDFLAYAVPTIRGEVRKHFRDHGWSVRPPRRVQELQAKINSAASELTQQLGRSPRPSELARHLDISVHGVEEALAADGCFTPSSLDRPVGGEDSISLGDLLPSEIDEHTAVDARVILAPAVRRLGERDQKILHLRFFNGWTQDEIAREIGVTQMHVSRLLTKILTELRVSLAGEPTLQ